MNSVWIESEQERPGMYQENPKYMRSTIYQRAATEFHVRAGGGHEEVSTTLMYYGVCQQRI